jgi:hypothetical protein
MPTPCGYINVCDFLNGLNRWDLWIPPIAESTNDQIQ